MSPCGTSEVREPLTCWRSSVHRDVAVIGAVRFRLEVVGFVSDIAFARKVTEALVDRPAAKVVETAEFDS